MKQNKTIKVVELFAGVGGFHIGFDRANKKLHLNNNEGYQIAWANQWEPSTKKQHAYDVYKHHFPKCTNEYSCTDIHDVVTNHFDSIPKHNLLVGGFPCQDYSVARTLNQAKGLVGKKGVLWWDIEKILKKSDVNRPDYLMLENVDRLLKSPANQRGRDFAIMLSSLNKLGYAVEWRVINAAEYGMPQRRKRTYILGYRKENKIYKIFNKLAKTNPIQLMEKDGVIAKEFPIKNITNINQFVLDKNLETITNTFNLNGHQSPFNNSGFMIDGRVTTATVVSNYKGKKKILADCLIDDESEIPAEYIIDEKDLPRWEHLKGAKNEPRKSKDGFVYKYSEGAMIFPDNINNPSRTIVTGEGGSSPSRFKHVIKTKNGGYRRLIPEELEALNMFPVGHTAMEPSAVKRAFFMGNALVVGVITKLAVALFKTINE